LEVISRRVILADAAVGTKAATPRTIATMTGGIFICFPHVHAEQRRSMFRIFAASR